MAKRRSSLAYLADIDLPVEVIAKGTVLQRIHRTALDPIHFGRGPTFRFDSPDKSYGVLYAARSDRLAFAETLLRGKESLVAQSEIEIRSLCALTLLDDLALVRLHGPGLRIMRTDASATSGSYKNSGRWSAALHEHRDGPDGILYRGTRDNDELAVALFERASAKVEKGTSVPLLDDPSRLGAILDHYGAGLV